jgi:dephospho-CoA kinase
MSFLLGLTGSIGMGKSTTARMFAEEGCEIWDADAAVHRLYGTGGAAVGPMRAAFPGVVRGDRVERDALRRLVSRSPETLDRIECIVHPLVARDRQQFRASAGADILVFDIPLLFETGGEKQMNAVACVSVPVEIQQKRVLQRGTMRREQFEQIRKKQLSDAEKRARADYVIITDTLDHARQQVQGIVADIRAEIRAGAGNA